MNLSDYAQIVADWAKVTPNVEAAYIFGSRAKGAETATSDLDVAVKLAGDDEGFANWICDAEKMRSTLAALISIPLDLQMMHSQDNIVMPAVLDHGMLVYEMLQT